MRLSGFLIALLLLSACRDFGDPVVEAPVQPPRIAYPDSVHDTVGIPVHHAPTSTGGPIASYTILYPDDALLDELPFPAGLTLDSITGVISGTPTMYMYKRALSIIEDLVWDGRHSSVATGPGGKDTASIHIRISRITVLPDPVPVPVPEPGGPAQIVVSMKLGSMNPPLSKLVVRLQANTSSDAPIFDTIVAGTQGFASLAPAGQTVVKAYTVKPLRNWTATVVAQDVAGFGVRAGAGYALGLLVGEARPVTVNVTALILP
jgi:hypothetical protein